MEHRLDREHYQICLSDKAKLSAELTHDFVVSETCGAVVTFHGTTRNAAKDGKECVRLDYSAYGDMALKQLAKIIEATREKYQLHRVAVHHHLGSVPPLESGVIGMCHLLNIKRIRSFCLVETQNGCVQRVRGDHEQIKIRGASLEARNLW